MTYQSLLLLVLSTGLTYITRANAQCTNSNLLATKTTQVISSPNYPNSYPSNYHCTWQITSSPLTNIVLFVKDLNLESSPLCIYDNVTVYDGQTIHSPKIATLCNEGDNRLYVSSGSYMTVEFITDSGSVDTGFQMEYFALYKTGDAINANSTALDAVNYITSPNYPNNYQSNYSLDCVWHITASVSTSVVVLKSISFFVQSNMPTCDDSYVSIYNGDSVLSTKMRTLCGQVNNSTNFTLTSTGPSMTVAFHSNNSLTPKHFMLQYQSLDPTDSCGNLYLQATSTVQYITSPNYPSTYPNNKDCVWRISTSLTSYVVQLTVLSFQLETSSSNQCTFDYLKIYNGNTTASTQIASLCGSVASYLTTSTGRFMTLAFHSDSSNGGTGFRLQYLAVDQQVSGSCGTMYLQANGTAQYITSPNYPNSYPNNLNCIWYISTPSTYYVIKLVFYSFRLESSSNCEYDYLAIYDGSIMVTTRIASLCGVESVPDITGTGTLLALKFHTDNSGIDTGFKVQYSAVYKPDSCGNIYLQATSTAQYITSPNYPSTYPNNMDCVWRISTSLTSYVVQLTVLSFQLETSSSNECTFDYLKIYNGNTTASTQIASLCGTVASYLTTSTGRFMTLAFHSDSSNGGTGFRLQYFAVDQQVSGSCGTMYLQANGSTQYITSPNYPNSYPNNLDCIWYISTSSTYYVIKLVFYSFRLESSSTCEYDYLAIYDGSITVTNIIASLCGVMSVPDITSTGTSLALKFHTDNSGVDTGLRVQYTAVSKPASCSSQSLTAYSSVNYIYSPNYPSNYYSNTDCTWHISASRIDYVVSLTIVALTLESGDCNSDYVKIYDGTSTYSTQLKWICGSYFSTTEIVSTGNDMVIVFHSNWYNNYSGFKISYRSKDPNPKSGLSGGAIAGIVIGILIVVFLFSIVFAYNKSRCTNKTNGSNITNQANRPIQGGTSTATNARNAPVSVVSRPNMSMPAQRPLQPGQQPVTFTQAYPSQFTGYSHPGQFGISNTGFSDAYGPPPPYSSVVTQS